MSARCCGEFHGGIIAFHFWNLNLFQFSLPVCPWMLTPTLYSWQEPECLILSRLFASASTSSFRGIMFTG